MTTLAANPTRPSTVPTTRRFPTIAALCFGALVIHTILAAAPGSAAEMLEFRGQTMGTTYMVKVWSPPPSIDEDIESEVDAELRRVNDQMSTYLESSEISRFNASESTDWFEVSTETATVVDYSLEVSRLTEGAFDVTIAPLVNLWNFGPEKRTRSIPSDADVAQRRAWVGFEQIAVRQQPPAIRKSNPQTQIDLSAIAKGHGVDRIVELLNGRGAANVFVEIGGEVRVTGDKGDDAWKVGIQTPDRDLDTLLVRHPITAAAMATSGDYRNRYEIDGQFFSHTIDPRTGRPITHSLASVTVVAETCMVADAWATAIDVLGAKAGIDAAEANGLSVLLASRTDPAGGGGDFVLAGTGSLAQYAVANTETADQATLAAPVARTWSRLLPMLAATLVLFGVVLGAMAIGVIFGRKPISGSCGGLAGTTNDNGTTRCSVCSNPVDGCQELRDRMQKKV